MEKGLTQEKLAEKNGAVLDGDPESRNRAERVEA